MREPDELPPWVVPVKRAAIAGLVVVAVFAGIAFGVMAALSAGPVATPRPSNLVAGLGSSPPSGTPTPPAATPEPSATGPSPSPTPVATPVPTPTPSPTPVRVPAPLDGRLVSPAAAALHPIAVMIDDLSPARPQSGFNSASIVYQAPAEGGIPRYMMIFQETTPTDVGPVRSSRFYYIAWAAEMNAVYAHAGGSPQALETLTAKGNGQLVYNADEFRWGGSFRRIPTRAAPHNLYTTGKQLRSLAARVGAKNKAFSWPWIFNPDAPLQDRPVGGFVQVAYRGNNVIRFAYDRFSNTYLRSVTGEKQQIDNATKGRVAPKNVIVMLMHFGPLNDGHPAKHRLEADVIGSGPAWVSTNGVTTPGTWKKTSLSSPTQFFDKSGRPIPLTVGQTFVQVMKTTDPVQFVAGTPAVPDVPHLGPTPI
jgi:hypothetical protein